METTDYTELLRQAEEELGKTPGAYCSRKAAVRAMELLQAVGQTELDKQHQQAVAAATEGRAVIQRQAEAIRQMEAEKTSKQMGSGIDRDRYIGGVDPIDGSGISLFVKTKLRERQRELERESWEQLQRDLKAKDQKKAFTPNDPNDPRYARLRGLGNLASDVWKNI